MGLKMLKPMLPTLKPRIGFASGDATAYDRQREATQHYRAWYKTARWQRLRTAVLVRDLFKCQFCGRTIAEKGKAIADHREPHRGDAAKFWNPANLQCRCAECHDSIKQAEEQAMQRQGS